MATMQERVAERYPSLVPLLKHPEIGKLLTSAVQQNWSPGVFQSKFIASRWFRSQSESQRRWWVLSATDPAEARRQRTLQQVQIQARASQLGIDPTSAEFRNILNVALGQGLEADDQYITNLLVNLAGKGGRTTTGGWTTVSEQIRSMSKSEYFWNVPNHVVKKWTSWILRGEKTMEDYQAAVQREAMARFPHMKEGLAGGLTVADQVRPLAEVWANEFDTTPEQVMASMRQHAGTPSRQLLGIRDAKTGRTRMPNEVEALRLARSQPTWWSTSSGRQNDAAVTQTLLRTFGKRK
jgi:hypothetical protein